MIKKLENVLKQSDNYFQEHNEFNGGFISPANSSKQQLRKAIKDYFINTK